MSRNKYILLIIILSLILASCKTYRFSGTKIEKLKHSELIDSINANDIEFEHFSFKFSAKIESTETSESFSGLCRIAHDSIIWISIQKMNIEGARILISKDSTIIINRSDKTVSLGSNNQFFNNFFVDMSLSMLQSLLTNRAYFYQDSWSNDKEINYRMCKSKEYYCLNTSFELENWVYTSPSDSTSVKAYHKNTFIPKLFKPESVNLSTKPKIFSFNCVYSNFKNYDDLVFPSNINLNIETNLTSFKINVDIQKPNIADKQSYPFKIPEKYDIIKF
ncbi:MAG: DUF4292 domain-containing protein [Bacteroidales bacterium]|nr:DUF4292 domain-containing protein [Bacteroidales bacterium]